MRSLNTHKRHNILCCNCFLSSGIGNIFKKDPNALLFSLVNPSGSKANKMNAKAGFDAGIHCEDELGPCFGVSRLYNFTMYGNEARCKCRVCSEGLGFQCPANVDFETYFTGSNFSTISELEVFKVDF